LDETLLDVLLCPACGGGLSLKDPIWETLIYNDGERNEVRSGAAACACGSEYPIEEFVLSLASLYPPELEKEASYWDRYYGWLLEQGSFGFYDLRLGQAPYITQGVPDPFPEAATLDRYTVHHEIAEHPLLRKGNALLDLGVGLGWTSLYFARASYQVTAFEPSLGPVRAAKRYAISQGVFIEYICAALGYVNFKPRSFHNVTAFHSLHHVPHLETELRKVRTWIEPGGTLAIDEHVGNSRLAATLAGEVHRWAQEVVLPRYRTLSNEVLARLPREPHSELEDSSVDLVAPLVSRLFDVRLSRPRHVFLDHYPLLYYLHTGRNLEAYKHALTIANQIQEMVRLADPEGGDYLTIVAENTGIDSEEVQTEPRAPKEVTAPETTDLPIEIEGSPFSSDLPARIAALEEELARQGQWARSLEGELRRKTGEINKLEALVQRLESGRMMRLLRAFNKSKR
jgi:2-polyprenyl-3-methyl-5-hydroxy-6-metoxy-1,4-benzoquinol methylase